MRVDARRRLRWLAHLVNRLPAWARLHLSRRQMRIFSDQGPGPRRVVLLGSRASMWAIHDSMRAFRTDNVLVLLTEDQPGDIDPGRPGRATALEARDAGHAADLLRAHHGSCDLVVDLSAPSVERTGSTWKALAPLIRDGGLYVVEPVTVLLGRLKRTLRDIALHVDWSSASGVAFITWHGIAVTKRQRHLALLHDDDVPTLSSREPTVSLRILAELAPGTLRCRAAVVSHTRTRPAGGLLEEMPFPAMQLRHYTGHIDFYGQTLLVAGNSVLPDSHRFYRHHNLGHPRTSPAPGMEGYVLPPEDGQPQVELPGSYYLLDPQYTGHYGHIMTEVVPRLWGWEQARETMPDLKVLAYTKPGRTRDRIIDRLLGAYGIGADEITYVSEPVVLESVVTATAMWHNFAPQFAHPDLPETWRRISDALSEEGAPRWEKVFVTRRPGALRDVHNLAEVESLFAAHGFKILRPEKHDLGVQASIFREARVVAGLGGSGMFNLMHARNVEQVIVLTHEAYTARNEHLYAALLGCREDWFWSVPDERRFRSSWRFDTERNGAELEALLGAYD